MAQLPPEVPRDAVIVTRNLQREYDMGGEYKTVNGIMKTPDGIAAWFKDTEGNIIGLFQG